MTQESTALQNVLNQDPLNMSLFGLNMLLNTQVDSDLSYSQMGSGSMPYSPQMSPMSPSQLVCNMDPFSFWQFDAAGKDLSYWIDLMNFFNQFYCQCGSSWNLVPEGDQRNLKSLNTKDIEIIQKLSSTHLEARIKARKEVLTSCSNPEKHVIFTSKAKGIKTLNEDGKRFRGSKYRGVSVNGKSWQVFIVINKIKWYAGWVNTEHEAAALYDKLAIIFHGLKAKTNFSYTKAEVLSILDSVPN